MSTGDPRLPRRSVSHGQVWRLAGPIILSNITVPLVGAVDTAVVGHLPDPSAIGAVALGALIFSFLYWGFGFLRMGTTGFVAKAFGADDWRELSDILLRVLLLSLVLGVVTILLGRPLIDLALYLLDSSANVEGLANDYASIRLWSAPAVLCVYAFTGIFIGMHDTGAAFRLQLMLNFSNILLDLLFVLGFDWGVKGVAVASLLAEYLAMFFGFYLLREPLSRALRRYQRARVLRRAALVELMTANSNIFLRTLCLQFGFAWFTAMSARQGEVILAANAILMHLNAMLAYGLDGFAHAAEALAGSAYGGGRRADFRRSVWLTSCWAALTALACAAVYLLLGEAIIGLFTGIDAVLVEATKYLPWMALMPLVAVWSYQLDGIFIGVGHTREMRNAMLLSLAGYLLALHWTLAAWGNHGLYLGLVIFMLLRTLSLLLYYPGIESALANRQSANR